VSCREASHVHAYLYFTLDEVPRDVSLLVFVGAGCIVRCERAVIQAHSDLGLFPEDGRVFVDSLELN